MIAGASGRKGISPMPRAPHGPIGSGYSRINGLDLLGHIQHGRDQVGGEVLGLDVAIFLDEVFQDGITGRLHHCAFDLPLHLLRVDRLAHIVGRDHIQQAHLAGLGIHFHRHSLRHVAIGKIRLRFAGLRVKGVVRGGRYW